MPLALPNNFKADIFGGLSAAIIALPLALGFGVAALAPLGPEHAATGALAGLYGAIFTGIFAALFGGTPAQVSGPTGPMTVVVTATTVSTMVALTPKGGAPDISQVLVIIFLTVSLGGVVQILLGLLKLGRFIKYIPYPVIAGFMNGIAVIIFMGQIEPFLGITTGRFWQNFAPQWAVVVTGTVTIATILLSSKLLPKIPGSLVGLVVGTATYLLLGQFAAPELLQFEGNALIIGEIPRSVPLPRNALEFVGVLPRLDGELLSVILPAAVTLGILGAIDSLLTSLVADVATQTQHNSNKELVGQGIGNIISGLFGGLSGAGATVRTLVNVQAGGRNRLSGITHGLVLLAVLLFLGSLASWIPMSVLGGILLVTAVKMVDQYSLQLLRKKTALSDVVVIATVTVVTAAVDLMVAVAIGVGMAVLLFLKRQVEVSIISRKYRCDVHRSRRDRPAGHKAALAEHGNEILIYELKGSLFFGTTDQLAADVRREMETPTRFVIFDARAIDHVDITGAELLKRIADTVEDAGAEFFFSGLDKSRNREHGAVEAYLRELNVVEAVKETDLFEHLDRALEAAESRLLDELGAREDLNAKGNDLGRIATAFGDLSDAEWKVVCDLLATADYTAEEVIADQEHPLDRFCLLESGHVTLYARSGSSELRLTTFGAGVHFGEALLLNEAPLPSRIVADTDTRLRTLDSAGLATLSEKHPEIMRKLTLALARGLLERLRRQGEELVRLEAA